MPWLHTEPCPQHFITCPWIQSLCGGDKFFSVCSYASWAIDSKCQAECIGQLFPHQSCITKHSEIQWLKITVFCFYSFVGEVGVSWSKLYLAVLGSKPQVGFHWNSLSLMFFASVSCLTSHGDGRSSRWQAKLYKYVSNFCNIKSTNILLANPSHMASPKSRGQQKTFHL